MKHKLFITSIILSLILVIAGYSTYTYYKNSATINNTNIYLIVKNNESIDTIKALLVQKSIIKSEKGFTVYNKLFGNTNLFKSGNYLIAPNTSFEDLILKLQSGQSDFAIVTIPEGYTLYQIIEKFKATNLNISDNILNSQLNDIDNNTLISKRTNVTFDLEGFLFPDTYYIPYSLSENDIIKLMYNRFKMVFSDKYISRAKELGLSINDIITIASLIEKEAAKDNERSKISGVIYNRIKKGMLLEIDAAVIYANTKGEKNISKVLYSHLRFDSKYNTYLYKGLPPGPIAAPGKASIEAALYPENHDYLFYVADGTGQHVFSQTYEEHLANVKKYIK